MISNYYWDNWRGRDKTKGTKKGKKNPKREERWGAKKKIGRARNLEWTGKILGKKEEDWKMWIQLRRKRKNNFKKE